MAFAEKDKTDCVCVHMKTPQIKSPCNTVHQSNMKIPKDCHQYPCSDLSLSKPNDLQPLPVTEHSSLGKNTNGHPSLYLRILIRMQIAKVTAVAARSNHKQSKLGGFCTEIKINQVRNVGHFTRLSDAVTDASAGIKCEQAIT